MSGRSPRASTLVKSSLALRQKRLPFCHRCSQPALISSSAPPFTSSYYHRSRRRNQSSWASAIAAAQTILNNATPQTQAPIADPLRTVAKEMKFLTKNIRKLLGSGHPTLDTVAKYYTQSEGKYVRPMLVLLMSRATALTPKNLRQADSGRIASIDRPISPSVILADENPSATEYESPASSNLDSAYADEESDILPSQRRLAEITELIHTASLLHDDVIDQSLARRSAPSVNIAFGNKMAVLAGDFLLGRASVALARLRDPEVVELLATVIANLVEGEFMQLKNTERDEKNPVWTEDTVTYYLQKTYLKSASLISKSCRAAALLGQSNPEVVEAAYSYGKNLGLAFQLVDDMLDYTISGEELGKPAGADLELGLATAPLLFAWKDNSDLGALVGRKFSNPGDVQKARELVARSSGLEQTRALAQDYVDKAIQAISGFPDSDAKSGLIEMCTKAITRRKIDVARRLRRAILLNDLLLVQRIVRNNPSALQNPDFEDKSNTSLHLAAKEGFLQITEFLINSGHEDEGVSRNSEWDTPLMLAAAAGHAEVGKLLLERFPRCAPWVNKCGMDALMCSSSHGTIPLIPLLLTNNPPCLTAAHDRDGNTALHHASAAGELKALRLLLQYGASPMAQNAYSWTPIAYSATPSAELYFKNLVAEFDKKRADTGRDKEKDPARIQRQRMAGAVRLVTNDESFSGSKIRSTDDTGIETLSQAPRLDWSPIESRRAMTPTTGRSEGWFGSNGRARASSGDR